MSNKALFAQLDQSGRRAAFDAHRAALLAQGMSGGVAWGMTVTAFAEYDGIPPLPQPPTDAPEPDDPQEPDWTRLHTAVEGRTCDELAAIRWCAARLHTSPASIDAADIPSAAALNLLRFLQSSPANEAKFWESSYPKLLPTRSGMADLAEDAQPDPGEAAALEAIATCQRIYQRAEDAAIEAARGKREKLLEMLHSCDAPQPDRNHRVRASGTPPSLKNGHAPPNQ